MLAGHLLTIEGGDGSGKTDQVKLLAYRLTNLGRKFHIWDFPQYASGGFGARIAGRMLAGKYGPLMEIPTYLAALPFVFDRLSVRDEMSQFMREGGVAICNRFTDSNLGHGGAKCATVEEARLFIDEFEQFEYGEMRLPLPDISFYLATDAELSKELVLKKSGREYLGGAVMTDEAEMDLEHQTKTRAMYEYLCASRPRFARIECMTAPGQIDTREAIHERLWEELNRRFVVDGP